MRSLYFHPEAAAEFETAIIYYESCERGLGVEFSDEILATIENILAFPNAWPEIENGIFRCQTRRFPFGVLYSLEEEAVFVLAIMNLQRDPDYWKGERM